MGREARLSSIKKPVSYGRTWRARVLAHPLGAETISAEEEKIKSKSPERWQKDQRREVNPRWQAPSGVRKGGSREESKYLSRQLTEKGEGIRERRGQKKMDR